MRAGYFRNEKGESVFRFQDCDDGSGYNSDIRKLFAGKELDQSVRFVNGMRFVVLAQQQRGDWVEVQGRWENIPIPPPARVVVSGV